MELFLIAFILILVMNIYAFYFYQIAYEKGVKIANRKKCK